MKIFIATANIEEIKQANNFGILDGVTTNPSFTICNIVDGDVSAEVISTDYNEILKEARALVQLGGNVVVKIPLRN